MINKKAKGYKAEKDVCKILSKYFTGEFNRRGLGAKGTDILASNDKFGFAVEVKHHKTVKAIHLLLGKNKQLLNWWKQARQGAKSAGKEPLLIVKVDGHFMATDMPPEYSHWYPLEIWAKHQIP